MDYVAVHAWLVPAVGLQGPSLKYVPLNLGHWPPFCLLRSVTNLRLSLKVCHTFRHTCLENIRKKLAEKCIHI